MSRSNIYHQSDLQDKLRVKAMFPLITVAVGQVSFRILLVAYHMPGSVKEYSMSIQQLTWSLEGLSGHERYHFTLDTPSADMFACNC